MTDLHKIVIVGGGAGGLELATQLGKTLGKAQKADIILIDQNLTHIWKPKLHEIAAGSMNPATEETNYLAHAAKHHYRFVLAKFINLDPETKQVFLAASHQSKNTDLIQENQLSYDTLILAVGSTSHDFGTKGVKEHCHFIDNRKQAENFHHDLLNVYLDAQHNHTERALNIAIIGAGATGVELAAELISAKDQLFTYGLNQVDPNKVTIRLIEAADRILPALSAEVAKQTTQQLKKMGIEILSQHRVAEVDNRYVHFTDQSRLEAEMVVWAAGIKAPDVIAQLKGFEKDHLHRLKVYATLQTLSHPDIFAFGDCAHCQPSANEPVLGPRAQVASQQASFLVNAMQARIQGKPLPMFKFSEKGALVSLSEHKAVGELLGHVNVQGALAKMMYVSLYRLHLATIHGYTYTGALTIKDILTKNFGPKIKLH